MAGGSSACGVAIIAWAASYLGTGSGEKEFHTTLDAMKQVHTFRVAYSASPGTQHNEMMWEVDCDRAIVHGQSHYIDTSRNPPIDMKQEEINVANRAFNRKSDGSWAPAGYGYQGATAKWYCGNLAQGTDSNILPEISTMIRRGILQKGDKRQ